jgi:hypothetical protein
LYRNGVCDVETSCTEPDIDCFVTFDTPEAAKAWYDASPFPQVKGASAPVTDGRFAMMQSLLDEGWEAYQAAHEVGDLKDKRVQLVLVTNDERNAFVVPEFPSLEKAGLAVMVNTGLIDFNAPKEQLMGIVMHELEHAIGLHVVKGVKERTRRYYIAPAGAEPLGFEQVDDPIARAVVEDWLFYSDDVGYMTDVELAGLPMPDAGVLGKAFVEIVKQRRMAAPAACQASVQQLEQLYMAILQTRDPLSLGIALNSTAPMTIVNVLTKLRDECFMGVTGDAITHVARVTNTPEAQLRASLPAEIRAAVEGNTVIVGIHNWVNRERIKMREAEARFQMMTGQPFSRARYFSTEEAADDSSVVTLDAMGLPADGIGLLLPRLQNIEETCRPMVNAGAAIPYGEDLTDDHHATCWRAGHAKQVAANISPRVVVKQPLGPMPQRARYFAPRIEDLASD